jgi:hypothetical protein
MEVFSIRETRWKSQLSHLKDGSPVGMIRTLSSGMQENKLGIISHEILYRHNRDKGGDSASFGDRSQQY